MKIPTGPQDICPTLTWTHGFVDRKLRLWGIACVRRFLGHLDNPVLCHYVVQGLIAAERYAERQLDPGYSPIKNNRNNIVAIDELDNGAIDELDNGDAEEVTQQLPGMVFFGRYRNGVVYFGDENCMDSRYLHFFDTPIISATRACLSRRGSQVMRNALLMTLKKLQKRDSGQEKTAHAALFYDIFGPPVDYRKSLLAYSDGQKGTIASIAQMIYEEQNFSELPVLGDALEDAGCDIVEALEQCRNGGPHARGNWVIDSLLGFHTTYETKKRWGKRSP